MHFSTCSKIELQAQHQQKGKGSSTKQMNRCNAGKKCRSMAKWTFRSHTSENSPTSQPVTGSKGQLQFLTTMLTQKKIEGL